MHKGELQAAGMKPVGPECSEFDGRGHLAFLYLLEAKKPPKHLEYVFQAKDRHVEVALTWLAAHLKGVIRQKRSSEADRHILGVSQRRAKVGLAKPRALATSLRLNLQPAE